MSGPLVEVRDLVKEFRAGGSFGRTRRLHAVSRVDLSIYAGETLGLVGESGCGKSTLGRMIVALETPTAGEIRFDGTTLGELSRGDLRRLRRNLQLMFQDPYASLSPRLSIGAIVSEPLRIQRVGTRAERQRRVAELIGEVGLPADVVDRFAHELSGGQRQRVGLARALALRPRLIVADEPVSALDVSIRSQILNLMKQVGREHGLTYLFISHDLSVVRYVADRIGVMYLGTLMEIGPSESVYTRPAHPYTRALLDAVPVLDPAVERHREQSVLGGEMPSPLNPPSGCRFRTRCPRAELLCAEVAPEMTEFAPSQFAACHFPLIPAASCTTDRPASGGVTS